VIECAQRVGSVLGVHGANCSAGSGHAVGAISDTGYCYDANGNQSKSMRRSDMAPQRLIYYTVFDKPSQMDSYEVGGPGHSTKYGYGPAREMAWRIDVPQYAGLNSNASVEVQYFGGVELELRRITATETKETYKRMIGGVLQVVEERTVNDSTAAAVSPSVTVSSEVMLKDHLGSTHVIVNSNGTNPQYQRFDVWGMRADAVTGSTQSIAQSYATNNPNDPSKTGTRKGFTGHEMVDGAGIVHMQGRIYDPKLGRFLQADPVIQDPLNAQNYNRYTYVYNNPLSLTDPSGYRSLSANLELYWKPVAAIAVLTITGHYAGIAKTTAEATAWSIAGGATAGLINSGTLQGAIFGAIDGGLTYGIGKKYAGNLVALLVLHSFKGGMLEQLSLTPLIEPPPDRLNRATANWA
jgi:RHS repeat-associated protein